MLNTNDLPPEGVYIIYTLTNGLLLASSRMSDKESSTFVFVSKLPQKVAWPMILAISLIPIAPLLLQIGWTLWQAPAGGFRWWMLLIHLLGVLAVFAAAVAMTYYRAVSRDDFDV